MDKLFLKIGMPGKVDAACGWKGNRGRGVCVTGETEQTTQTGISHGIYMGDEN